MLTKKDINKIPDFTGVYLFKNQQKKVIYVGKALSLKKRVSSYITNHTYFKSTLLKKEISSVNFIKVPSEVEALILEANLIKLYLPKFNSILKDDKSFLYIVITKDIFPRVLAWRKSDRRIQVKYQFGPYPSSGNVRNVLKLIRRIFPYCTQSPKLKKACFYSHINLCNPCPGDIRKMEYEKYRQARRVYLNNINNIKHLLENKFSILHKNLIRKRENFAKKLMFEKASKIQKQINYLDYITKPYYQIASFLDDPNFLNKITEKKLDGLKDILKPYFNISKLTRIEGIDVSNISGNFATGSLVVFINGLKSPSDYKRFKIKTKGQNDPLMLNELLERRLNHHEWIYPDLILVDGGKPQISKIQKTLKNFSQIPVIGLAKNLETIVVPSGNKFILIHLSRNTLALKLLQEVRDEAHRFARKYHQFLRKKYLLVFN